MKALFLDIDGVLNRFVMNAPQIEPLCVENLSKIFRETGCHAVLSSSWRHVIYSGDMTIEGFAMMLRSHGLRGLKLIDAICREGELPTRGKEIRRWLSEHRESRGVTTYCILDDDCALSELHGERLVRTNEYLGLTDEDAEKAIAILNSTVSNERG